MAEFPALPLWTDALVADTAHLSPAEFGAYMRLLIAAWRSRECALLDDDRVLGRLSGDPHNWRRLRPTVMAFWALGEDGRWRQKRLSKERAFLEARSAKAKDAAFARWSNSSPREPNSASPRERKSASRFSGKSLKMQRVGDALASLGHVHPHPNPYLESSSSTERRAREAETVRVADGTVFYAEVVRKADLINSDASLVGEAFSRIELETMVEVQLVTAERMLERGLL